jgi:hypothetical protein
VLILSHSIFFSAFLTNCILDQAVTSLMEIWRPPYIPTIFLSSGLTFPTAAAKVVRGTSHPSLINSQLPSPVTPSIPSPTAPSVVPTSTCKHHAMASRAYPHRRLRRRGSPSIAHFGPRFANGTLLTWKRCDAVKNKKLLAVTAKSAVAYTRWAKV